jgi:hypothetical protein
MQRIAAHEIASHIGRGANLFRPVAILVSLTCNGLVHDNLLTSRNGKRKYIHNMAH